MNIEQIKELLDEDSFNKIKDLIPIVCPCVGPFEQCHICNIGTCNDCSDECDICHWKCCNRDYGRYTDGSEYLLIVCRNCTPPDYAEIYVHKYGR